MRGCIQPKSAERIAVEALLAAATVENPATVEQIARVAGCDPGIVRTHIHNAINRGEAHNLRAGNNRPGLYVAGLPVKAQLPRMPAPRTAVEFVPLKLKPWSPPRAESLHAFKLPSVELGQRRDRTPPASMCGPVLQPVGIHGLKFA